MNNQLSFWEDLHYMQVYDYIIVGAGFVGTSAALKLKELNATSKILIIEKELIGQGASTKNAGFSCFGSVGELEDDLLNNTLTDVAETVEMRWKGLQKLRNVIPENKMEYKSKGGWELFRTKKEFELAADQVSKWNKELHTIIGKQVFAIKDSSLKGFYKKAIYTPYEGQLNPNQAIQFLHKKATRYGIDIVKGLALKSWENQSEYFNIETSENINLRAKKIIITTNGFTPRLIDDLDLRPARNQVLITKPIKGLTLQGNYHLDKGYIYLRNVGNRLLLGGARFLSDQEYTDEYGNTSIIQDYLSKLLRENILDNKKVEIERWWSGILGIGKAKYPIIKEYEKDVFVGVRLGGMGVAIGLETGEKLAQLVLK